MTTTDDAQRRRGANGGKEGAVYLWQLLYGDEYLAHGEPTGVDPPEGYDLHSWQVTFYSDGTINELVVCWKRCG